MAGYELRSPTKVVNLIDYSFMEVKPTGISKADAPYRTVTVSVTFEDGTTTQQQIMNVAPDYWTDYYTVSYQAINGQYSIASEVGNPISYIAIVSEINFTDGKNSPYVEHNTINFSSSKEPEIKGNSVTLASNTIAMHTLELYKSDDLSTPVFIGNLMSTESVTLKDLEYNTEYTYVLARQSGGANVFSFTTGEPTVLCYVKVNGVYKQGILYSKDSNNYKEVIATLKENNYQ